MHSENALIDISKGWRRDLCGPLDYTYIVLRGNNQFLFSSTAKEHVRAVSLCGRSYRRKNSGHIQP